MAALGENLKGTGVGKVAYLVGSAPTPPRVPSALNPQLEIAMSYVRCPAQVTRLWNRLAKTERISPEDFIGWAKDKFESTHPEWDRMYLLFFEDWSARTFPRV